MVLRVLPTKDSAGKRAPLAAFATFFTHLFPRACKTFSTVSSACARWAPSS